MTVTREFDYNALKWVRGEIDATLNEARLALEAYVTDPRDTLQLGFCITYLHQVRGTLQMVELYGAALLAEEMETLAQALQQDQIAQKQDAFEVLMRAILQLPTYLERLEAGQRDIPLVLLPILNDLRAVRSQNLLSENVLFAPDLTVGAPASAAPATEAREFDSLVRRLRPAYQVALVAWYRSPGDQAALQRLTMVIDLLEQAASDKSRQFFWIAHGLMEALSDRGLANSAAIKLLLGQVDRQLKSFIDAGEEAVTPDLIKNLLYYVGQSRSDGARVNALKDAFNLRRLLPDHDALEQARADLGGPDSQLMQSVSTALKEELLYVKEVLDLFVRNPEASAPELEPMVARLRQVGDTLGMLGLGVLRGKILEQVLYLSDVVSGLAAPSESGLMKVAGALLYVESSLAGLSREAARAGRATEAPETGPLPESEYHDLTNTVIQEALADIARCKEVIGTFSRQREDIALLQEVPQWLAQVQGGLVMVGLHSTARLMPTCQRFARHLLAQRRAPEPELLDRLADAITCAEYYLECFRDSRIERDEVLALGEHNVALLEKVLEAEGAPEQFVPAPELAAPAEAEAIPAEPAEPEPAFAGAAAEFTAAAQPWTTVPAEPEFAPPSPEAIEPVTGEVAAVAPTLPEPATSDIDQEVIEVFLEEAGEEIASIGRQLGFWESNTDNREALTTLRRSFHTLKGSGRLVGAANVGEFAWKIESMLNRVIEGAVQASAPLFTLLHQAREVLPRLVAQFRGEGDPGVDVAALMAVAEALSQPPAAPAAPVAPVVAAPEPSAQAPVAAEAPAPLESPEAAAPTEEDDIAALFLEEARQRLDEISQHLNLCEQRACPPLDELLPVLHGLQDCAGAAEAETMASLAGAVQRCLSARQEQNRGMDAATVALVRECHGAMSVLLESPVPAEQLRDLEQRLVAQTTPEAPAAPAAAPVQDLPVSAEQPEEVRDIFLEEAAELTDMMNALLRDHGAQPAKGEWLDELQRAMHTFKGGARMAGLFTLADLSHSLETLLKHALDGAAPLNRTFTDLLQQALDRLVQMVEAVRARATPAADHNLLARIRTFAELPAAEQTAPQAPAPAEEPGIQAASLIEPPTGERRSIGEYVRVHIDTLDNLVNAAAEIGIFRTRHSQQSATLRTNLNELDQVIKRLHDQLRRLEIETEAQMFYRSVEHGGAHGEVFDPLEFDHFSQVHQLTRGLMESADDLISIQRVLGSLTRETDTLLDQQERINTGLQEGLMRVRMVAFSNMVPRLRHLVRQVCRELGKQAELEVYGGDVELDRTVLNRLMPMLEHMLRNALDHGIEPPAGRVNAGKPPAGRITINLTQEGPEVVITISDDGHGIDLEAVRRQALARRLMSPQAELSDTEVMHFILESGFSTARQLTQISGRGVGMDVVNTEIKQLGGALAIDTAPGKGSRFTLYLPLTLAAQHAILAGMGQDVYAMPLAGFIGIVRVPLDQYRELIAQEDPVLVHQDRNHRLLRLANLLGLAQHSAPATDTQGAGAGKVPLLLYRTGEHFIALEVDRLLGHQEVVVKSVGPQVSAVRGISGGTVLSDGRVALILDINALVRANMAQRRQQAAAVPDQAERGWSALIVDDSITMRKVTSRLLERNNIHTVTANDGMDAVDKLQHYTPDIILLDIEMPRMNGYEFAELVRSDERLRHIPIIMITSRTGAKHREHALQLGVNRYLGKPFKDAELLENIRELLGSPQ